MFKRRLNGKMLTALAVLLLAVCVSAFAGLRDGAWEVNPSAFRYDMSLYFKLADKDYEDLEKYEIGAFVGDECRGVAEMLELTEGETCLYMRIRSNQAQNEIVDFLLRNRESGDTVILKAANGADFKFESGARVGMPSDPFMMACFFNVAVAVEGKGSVDFTDGLYAAGTMLSLKAVPAEGYHFESWSNGAADESASFTVDGNLQLTATFSPNIYKVVFELDGEEFKTVEVTYGSAIEAPEAPAKVGYAFSGWTDLPDTMPAQDLTVKGSYAINSYDIVFKADGEIISSAKVEYGAPVSAPAAPVKQGYTFNGWGDVPSVMPAHDVEVHGTFSVNKHMLSFTVDGETISTSEVAYGTSIVAPEPPSREGYSFQGWTELPATMPDHNVDVVGKYAVNTYKVTFRIADEIVSEAELAFGSELKAPAAPVREGYTFDGWKEFPEVMPAHDLEVTGSYTVNSYKLDFTIGDETILSSVLDFGASIVAPEAPAKEGYSFRGWGDVPSSMPAKDLTLSGSYEINKYKLVFRIGEEIVSESEIEYGAAVTAPQAAAKEGHTFAGWSVFPAVMPAHDVDVTGSYSVNVYAISFSIGDEVILSSELPYGSSIVAPEAPAKEGYAFTGWGDVPAVMPASDLAFTGDYEMTDYNVVYKIDGEPVYASKVTMGKPVPAFEAPAKEGFTFSGWGEIPSVMPAQDLEFNGTYAVNSYKLVFKADEDVIFEGELTYGSEISIPAAPAKKGHTFVDWKDVPAKMPAKDLLFESTYTVNTYTIKYLIEEEDFLTAQYKYGEKIEAPTAPEQEGHSFSGWGEIPATMPDFDLVFGGTYAENFYTVTFRIDGAVIFTDDVEYGTDIIVPDAPVVEGYTFNGWGNVPVTMPAANLEYDGSYTVNSYAVSFKIDDEEIYSGTLAYGAGVSAPEVPAKEGHTFKGWGVVPSTMPAADLEIVGEYEVNSYNVSFMADGNVFQSLSVAYGSKLSAPDAPAKEGYSFIGWSGLPATMPAYDLVVDGTYSVNSYALSFRIGEEEIFSGSLNYGVEIVIPEAPAKEGHSFAGWGMVPSTMPATDLEIKGSYEVNSYNLTYLIDGQSFSASSVPYGTPITVPSAPAKEGHTFVGWNDVPATMPATDLIVSGTYTVNSYKLVFKAAENAVFEGELTYGSEISVPEAPAKVGYTFGGWGMVPETMPASDLTVTGEYKVNYYEISYLIDGQDFYSVQVPYGSKITVPEAPAKEGHTFTGWADALTTMPANNIVISGSYSVNSYGLTFRIGEDIVFSGRMPYGTEIAAPAGPAKEGHTFNGWGMVPATMPASDLTFEGGYDVNIYNLAFDIDGEPFFQTQLAYGTEIKAPMEIPDKEGNTFGGWGDVPATMPANDLAISGTYSPNHYTLTFKIGEEIVFTGEQPYGSEVVAPEAPAKEGYSFTGWNDVPATVPARNVEVFGAYQINQYELKFSVDGEELYSGIVTYGDPVEAPEVEPKRGHTFSGFGVIPATMPATDLHLTGTYDINHYSVLFKIGDDVVYSAQIPFGGKVTAPEAPEKEGFAFLGWGGVPSEMPAENLVFEGKYSANAYTLTFRLDGEVLSTAKYEAGDEISAPEVAEKEGYTFGGWGVVPSVMPASDLVINGAYDVNYYNVTFRVGEDILVSAQVPFGGKLQTPTAPAKEGHTFTGWGEVPAVMPASDLEFVASYEVNKYQLTFKVDDEVISSSEVAYGADVKTPEAAAKEGYSFSGWGVVPPTMPAHDVVVSGTYSADFYAIVFKIGDEVFHSAQLPYGAVIQAPEAPAKEGYTFSGWGNVPSTMPASEVEVKGDYTVNSYKLVFKVDGAILAESTVKYGSEITVPAVADKEGHTFSGFGIVPAAMPASDLEFNGKYEVNTYNVVFKINDDVVYSAQLPYGSEITAPEVAATEGLTFSGWSEYPKTVPAEDVLVTGSYAVNSYRLLVYINGEVYLDKMVEYGAPMEIPEPTVDEDKIFKGWDEEVPSVMPAHEVVIHGTVEKRPSVGVAGLDADSVITVFSIDGVLLYKDVKASEISERLTPGIYIINGRKMIVR